MGVYVHRQVKAKHRAAVDELGREFAAALA